MRYFSLSVFLVALVGLGATASAAADDRFRTERAANAWRTGQPAERSMARFARCAVRADPERITALLATPAGSAAENRILTYLARRYANCLIGDTDMASSSVLMRGAIAERVYLDRFPEPLVAPRPSASPFVRNPAVTAHFEVARCAAMRDPASADRLVRAPFRSPDEAAALQSLMPVLGACVASGSAFQFDRVLLHGALAEALLKMQQG